VEELLEERREQTGKVKRLRGITLLYVSVDQKLFSFSLTFTISLLSASFASSAVRFKKFIKLILL